MSTMIADQVRAQVWSTLDGPGKGPRKEPKVTDSNYVHYVLIIDRSGSMYAIADETQHGIKEFIEEQKQLGGRATLSLYQFDHTVDTVHDFTKLADVVEYQLKPRGNTALLDAIGFAFTQVGEKLAAMPGRKRPGKVVVVIATDGQENFSAEYKLPQIKSMITKQQDVFGWQVTYIGANQDSFAEAGGMGIAAAATMDFAPTAGGTSSAWRGVSHSTASFAGGQSANVFYTDAQRTEAKDDL